jgi:hypothetical protein
MEGMPLGPSGERAMRLDNRIEARDEWHKYGVNIDFVEEGS